MSIHKADENIALVQYLLRVYNSGMNVNTIVANYYTKLSIVYKGLLLICQSQLYSWERAST